jgi:hypothetical protein
MERMTVRIGRILAAAAMLLAAACSRGGKAGGNGPYAKEVAQSVPMIEKGTGLTFKRPPKVETRTKEQVRSFLMQRLEDEHTTREITGQEIFYRHLGVIPDTLDLRKFMVDLLSEQVVGFYDPKTKVLYIVDGAPKEQVGFVISHELVHALQDQYMNLDSIQDARGNNDRSLAAQAVIEGQAMLVPIQAALGPGIGLPGGWDRVRDLIRENQSQMPIFSSAPFMLKELLIFPYLSGAEFMRRFQAERPGQTPYGANMPISTEQILHAPAYFGARKEEPIDPILPTPSGGEVLYTDNMGEFETRLFLFQFLQDQNEAVRTAAGWRGDRYAVIRTPRGDGIVWLSMWDSPVQAAQFGSDMEQIVGKRFNSPTARETSAGKTWSVAGRSITLWGGSVAGHPAVMYTDMPAGVGAGVDVKKVTVKDETVASR